QGAHAGGLAGGRGLEAHVAGADASQHEVAAAGAAGRGREGAAGGGGGDHARAGDGEFTREGLRGHGGERRSGASGAGGGVDRFVFEAVGAEHIHEVGGAEGRGPAEGDLGGERVEGGGHGLDEATHGLPDGAAA